MSEILLREGLLLALVWLISQTYQDWCLLKAARLKPKGRKGKPRAGREFAGLTKKPECPLCEGEEAPVPEATLEPPPLIAPKCGAKRQVDTSLQYCPYRSCRYYGWPGRGNISSNGHPNGGVHRQLYCCVCQGFFVESLGTIFYGKRIGAETITRAITALAEGIGIRAVSRIFVVEPETILAWLVGAAAHLEAFNSYMTQELQVEQVQLDELYGVIRAYQTGAIDQAAAIAKLAGKRRPIWLWTAIDPVSKFWLAAVVGQRDTDSAWAVVHQVARVLKQGIVPLFITDGYRAYEKPILIHYGHWQPPKAGQHKPRWFPLPDLLYAQVVKKRRRRRLVSVTKRAVFGPLARIKDRLAPFGWQINTAFVERHNLTIRHLVSGLGRRVNTLVHSPERLAQQVSLAQAYYNFCRPTRSLQIDPTDRLPAQARTPAMALGLTTKVWSLKEVLLFKPPPFPVVR